MGRDIFRLFKGSQMTIMKVVQLLSMSGILLAGATERVQATETPAGYCFVCASFGSCPADDGAATCALAGCPSTNPGCVEGFGSCEVAIGCNEGGAK
jgi:hypothetical protein